MTDRFIGSSGFFSKTGVVEVEGTGGDANISLLIVGVGDDIGVVGTLISSSEVMLAIDFSSASSTGSVLMMADTSDGTSGLLTSGSSFFTPTAKAAYVGLVGREGAAATATTAGVCGDIGVFGDIGAFGDTSGERIVGLGNFSATAT
jgi:hypothetical protein